MNLVVADTSVQGDAALALALFDLLKSTRTLEYMAHQFHWNIIGDKFQSMHEFYSEEYEQLFKDQDEIAEQIRQQGFFVPIIDNFVLGEEFNDNDFESQLLAYNALLEKNIEVIDKVNDLAKDNIAVQDLCARLKGLRSLTQNLKVKAMLKANNGILNPEASVVKADVIKIEDMDTSLEYLDKLAKQLDLKCKKFGSRGETVYYGKITIPVEVYFELSLLGCGAVDTWPSITWNDITKITKETIISNFIRSMQEGEKIKVTASVVESAKLFKEGDKVTISGDISNGDYNCRVSSTGVVEEDQKTPNSKVRVTIDEIDGDRNVSMLVNPKIVALASAKEVTAGFDKGRYKEIDEEPKFFKILREDCGIKAKTFYAVNRGLRLAIRIVKGTFENASIRYFALKSKGGYVRVELNDKVYIIGYTIYDSGKIKVWTRELKTAVPVNSFDYAMLNMYAKPFGTKMVTGMLPTWMSI